MGRGDDKCVHNFSRETEGKRPLGRPRHRGDYKIKIHKLTVRKYELDEVARDVGI
jgi:hypothetical protein